MLHVVHVCALFDPRYELGTRSNTAPIFVATRSGQLLFYEQSRATFLRPKSQRAFVRSVRSPVANQPRRTVTRSSSRAVVYPCVFGYCYTSFGKYLARPPAISPVRDTVSRRDRREEEFVYPTWAGSHGKRRVKSPSVRIVRNLSYGREVKNAISHAGHRALRWLYRARTLASFQACRSGIAYDCRSPMIL